MAHIGGELSESPVVSVGMDLLLGKECITTRGEVDPESGCWHGRAAVGVGTGEQYFFFKGETLTLLKLLELVGIKIDTPIMLSMDGWMGEVIVSFSGTERTLPTGDFIPVGLRLTGRYFTLFGLVKCDLDALIPLTPSMINILLGNAASSAQLISEFVSGYELKLDADLTPLNFLGGALVIQRSRTDSRRGPHFHMHLVAKPAELAFSFESSMEVYVSALWGVFELEMRNEITLFGMRLTGSRNFFGIKWGFMFEAQLADGGTDVGQFVRALADSPGSILDKSSLTAEAHIDFREFNRRILDPLNDLVDEVLDFFRDIARKVPVAGGLIVDLIDGIAEVLRIRVYSLGGSMTVSRKKVGMMFHFSGRFFGFDVRLSAEIAIQPDSAAKGLLDSVVKPLYRLVDWRGWPKFLHCSKREEQFLLGCAPKCRSNYKSLFPMCLEKCRSGYTDLGLGCARGGFGKTKKCGLFGIGVPCGCEDDDYKFLFVTCISLDYYWKDLYFRPIWPIHTCWKKGKSSKEYWPIPLCYKKCKKGSKGGYNFCIDDRLYPF